MSDELRYPLIRRAIAQTPWAILPSKLDEIVDFIAYKASGGEVTAEELHARFGAESERSEQRRRGSIAVLPVMGTLSHRMNMLTEASGGASYESLTLAFRELVNDESVGAIVLDVDSPGGSVAGVDELTEEIYQARGTKPIYAVANALMASAAYWVASAADVVVVTPSAQVGSIGVMAAHEDRSGMLEQLGVNLNIVSAGKYKSENNPFEPLTDEGRAEIQKHVDEAYERFISTVARNRSVFKDTVRYEFGEGRLVGASEAVTLDMADRIGTLDDVIATINNDDNPGHREVASSFAVEQVGLSFAEQEEAARAAVFDFVGRSRALAALRAEEGRTISQAHRERMLRVDDVLTDARAELRSVLATAPVEGNAAAEMARLRRNAMLRSADAVLRGAAD